MRSFIFVFILLFSSLGMAKATKVSGYVFNDDGKIWISEAPFSTDLRYQIKWHPKQRLGQICYYEKNQSCPQYFIGCSRQSKAKKLTQLESCRVLSVIKMIPGK
ncbi:hypothetical protein [Bdellovibrio bacteriovorus]|uniref:hypothetical protein n=1 Tax=Bdellovibrio bacteriovorus TaxID=959 RepID=UPI0035A8EF6F